MMKTTALVGVLALAPAFAAGAEPEHRSAMQPPEKRFYFGGTLGQAEENRSAASTALLKWEDSRSVLLGIHGGVHFTPWLSLEGSFHHVLGDFDARLKERTLGLDRKIGEVSWSTFALSGVVWMENSSRITPFVKGGLHRWKVEEKITDKEWEAVARAAGISAKDSGSGIDPLYGFGVAWDAPNRPVRVRIEWTQFTWDGEDEDISTDKLRALSLGAEYRF